jgi:hypothetical protein
MSRGILRRLCRRCDVRLLEKRRAELVRTTDEPTIAASRSEVETLLTRTHHASTTFSMNAHASTSSVGERIARQEARRAK